MKSSIQVSRNGRSITFRGSAANAAFLGMTQKPKAPVCEMCGGTGYIDPIMDEEELGQAPGSAREPCKCVRKTEASQ